MKKLLLFILCAITTEFGFAQIIHDNGTAAGGSGYAGLVTPGVSGSGGAPVSQLQGTANTLGAGHQITGFNRVADDFTVANTVDIDSLMFFAYQTGSTTTSTITDVRVRIFNGPPNAGGTVVYGDTLTNRLSATNWTGIYRAGATATDATRPIMRVKVNITPALNLPPGTYWIEWNCGGTLASGPWVPVLNHNVAFGAGNALQHLGGTTFSWSALMDGVQMGLPFIVYGNCFITSTASHNDAICTNNGTGTVVPTSGTAPYSYLWSNGQNTATATGLGAGTYTVTASDNSGCSDTQTITVASTTLTVSATTATTPSNCVTSTGTATATATNGTAPYTYIWSNGQTSETATGLTAGAQNITITDANGCTGEFLGIQVVTASTPAISIPIAANLICNGDASGNATASASGGTAPYTYVWSNGQTSESATGLAAGVYMVTVTDANACADSVSVGITEPAAIAVAVTATDASVAGAADGAVDITVSGGTTPYSFVWSNGATTEDISGVLAGTYTVTITDGNGCTEMQSGLVQDGPVAINITNQNFQISIFPNPAVDMAVLNIELTNMADVKIYVINTIGQVMQSINAADVTNNQFNLDMSEWASGVYFVRVTAGEETATYRLTKK